MYLVLVQVAPGEWDVRGTDTLRYGAYRAARELHRHEGLTTALAFVLGDELIFIKKWGDDEKMD